LLFALLLLVMLRLLWMAALVARCLRERASRCRRCALPPPLLADGVQS
jgi:hypothetical protein